jgi:SAM-dependent methyltransferase
MRNEDLWKPTKYVRHGSRWKPTRKKRDLTPGSRLIASLVAEKYEHYLPRFARGHLADLGCGKVPFYGMYRPYVSRVTCADWPQSLHGNLHIDIACSLADPLPFRDGAFDTVILSDVLEHIAQPQLCLEEIARILAPGGTLFLNTPFFYWLHETPWDYYRYTEYALRFLISEAGLSVEILEPVGGSPEVLADLAGKHLSKLPIIGAPLTSVLAATTLALRLFHFWCRISNKSARLFPLGYFAIARKPQP